MMMSRSSIPTLYPSSPGVLCSRCFSGLKRAVFSGGFKCSFDIRFVDFVVQDLSGYWMDPIPILYQTAPLKLVFFVQILKKVAFPCGAS